MLVQNREMTASRVPTLAVSNTTGCVLNSDGIKFLTGQLSLEHLLPQPGLLHLFGVPPCVVLPGQGPAKITLSLNDRAQEHVIGIRGQTVCSRTSL